MDEAQETHREDARKLVEMMPKEEEGLFSAFLHFHSCSLMATAIDEAAIRQAIMHGLASGGATRQAVAAAACAVLRTHRGDQRGDCLHLSMQEKLKALAKDFFGHEVGISQVVKDLRLNEHADLAKAVTAQHKCRNLTAHPPGDLDGARSSCC